MKILILILFFIIDGSHAVRLKPMAICENADKKFILAFQDKSTGYISLGERICAFEINDVEINRGVVSWDNVVFNFSTIDCNNNMFYKTGFLKIIKSNTYPEYSSHTLAIRGEQTFSCDFNTSDLMALSRTFRLKD